MSGDIRIISAERSTVISYLKQVIKYRSLIRVLAVRDIKIRYSQTFLGLLWAVVQPTVGLAIYWIFFYQILGISTGDVPYPVFALTGILGWFNFSYIINEAGSALQSHQDIIKRIDFPKMVLPLSKMLSGMVEVGITFGLVVILMIYFQVPFSWRILFFPAFLLLNQVMGLAVSLWLASLTIKYRDAYKIIPYLISFGIWVTPVFYPTTILPQGYEHVLSFNPIAAIITGYRWCFFGYDFVFTDYLFAYALLTTLLVSGFYYFMKVEDEIVDYI